MIFGKNKSLACFHPNPGAEYRVVCFPCAGGGASMYRSWSELLPEAEVWAANYPGRESLHGMPFS
nr:thioesterase [Gammaproteobacteria bacterium]